MNDPMPTPLQAMREVRAAQYGNSQEERAAIRAVDAGVLARARHLERAALQNAEAVRAQGDEADRAVHGLLAELRELDQEVARGAAVTPELAQRWRSLRERAERQSALLELADKLAEAPLATLADPRARLDTLVTKYPTLRAFGSYTTPGN